MISLNFLAFRGSGLPPFKREILRLLPDSSLTVLKAWRNWPFLAVDRNRRKKAAPGCPVRGP
ncbi:hypothetical protein [Dechloromonas sp. H13]|uniref:hypothetical protein n=1 Tax=Dechloromonas sp. H13 TaxID=2570193 RepID=UPI00129204A1|nr:hypothetical protein [Dechloromonas sp. H13]